MKRILIAVSLLFLAYGCTTVATPENIERCIKNYRQVKAGTEIILDVSYKEAFEIVDKRLDRRWVIRSDYDNKVILYNISGAAYRIFPVIIYFEEEAPNRTRLILKGHIEFMPAFPQQLKDDADLRNKGIR